MKKKTILSLCMMTLLIMVLSGCRVYTEYNVKKGGAVTESSYVAYSKDELEGVTEEDLAEFTLKTLEDGKEYYVSAVETSETTAAAISAENNMNLTEDIFYYSFGSTMESLGLTKDDLYMEMTLQFEDDIVDTNANIEVAGNKVVFDTTHPETIWYAYTNAGKTAIEQDTKAPEMVGAKDNKYYKDFPRNVRFTDDVAVKKVVLNGKEVFASYVTEEDKITDTFWSTADGNSCDKNGKNTFKVYDLNDNVATYTIYVDKKAPTIKGAKNNKTYKNKVTIYVKDNNKVSKVTINGKKQKVTNKQLVKKGKYKGYYKYTITKKGTNKIVIRDAVGNKKTLKVKIKK